MKKILGLDIGTNSIGAALIELQENNYGTEGKILWLGSRIIPTDASLLGKFETGQKLGADTPAAQRRAKRMARRIKDRYVLRRTRLIRAMKVLEWLDNEFPENFKTYFDSLGEQTHEGKTYRISDTLPFSEATVREATALLGVPYQTDPKKRKRTASQKARVKVYDKLVVPEDWIVWYLRKKALYERITKSEFARILYMMNQRRGFKSGRKDFKEEGEENVQRQWVELVTIRSVTEDTEYTPGKDGKRRYVLVGHGEETDRKYIWDAKRFKIPDWEGKCYTLLLTENYDKKKNTWKFLTPQNPTPDNWGLQMVSLDNQIGKAGLHPGEFFFNNLAADKNYKIRQQVVKRKRYEDELHAIWTKQQELWGNDQSPENPRLGDNSKLEELARTLYPAQSNFDGPKYREIVSNDLYHAFADDIIYYQRDLKSQKDSVSGCRYEKLEFRKKGEKRSIGRKASPISSPEFQEFRIWQDIHNIRAIEQEAGHPNDILPSDPQKQALFQFFDTHESVSENDILKIMLPEKKKGAQSNYKINLFANRTTLKGNETKDRFRKLFQKYDWKELSLLGNQDILNHFWHIAYSIPQYDRDSNATNGRANGLLKWAKKAVKNSDRKEIYPIGEIPKGVVDAISTMPDFPDGYAALSLRAIRKLLPLMRVGDWKWENIDEKTQIRIDHVLSIASDRSKIKHDTDTDTYSDTTTGEILEKQVYQYIRKNDLTDRKQFQGLPMYMAAYVVYGKHSEQDIIPKYEKPEDIDVMKLVPNKVFNNPIVEKVIRETLCVVRDLWKSNHDWRPDEIHIELARDLKKNAKERERISKQNKSDREDKEHIRAILRELLNDPNCFAQNGRPNPNVPKDVEKFRLWMQQAEEKPEELYEPSGNQVEKYWLWLKQQCFSPYTGDPIPLSKLFTEEYDVDHILPRSRIKNDGLDNLVVVEHAVNSPEEGGKGNDTAAEFIKRMGGRTVKGRIILTWDKYEKRCRNMFAGRKLQNLLREGVPDDFISRQLNDTRHIVRKVSHILAPVANDPQGIVYTTGSITSDLKSCWGLNEVWKEILKPRFERLERLGMGQFIFPDDENPRRYHFRVPDQPDFETKRIDHRHHSLDALIIACTTRGHIKYLNTLNAAETDTELKQLRTSLVVNGSTPRSRKFKTPWKQVDFCRDARLKLEGIIVSFKQQKPPISKPSNKRQKWIEKNGKWQKVLIEQKSNPQWLSVRRSMFKQPMGSIWIKQKREEKNLLKAFKIQLDRIAAENDLVARTTADYIYDKDARSIFKEVIEAQKWTASTSEKEIKDYLKKNKIRDSNGDEITGVLVAVFVEYASKRVPVNDSFTKDKINKIPYADRHEWNPYAPSEMKPTISNLLQQHLANNKGESKVAFGAEGMEALNKLVSRPIRKVTTVEKKENPTKFRGQIVETDVGSNVFFAITENRMNRSYESLSVLNVLEKRLKGEPFFHESETGFLLSPGEIVYIPSSEEKSENLLSGRVLPMDSFYRVYRMISCSGSGCEFRPHYIASPIVPYKPAKNGKPGTNGEIGHIDKSQTTFEYNLGEDGKVKSGETIKTRCIKITVDRLGRPIIA